MERSTVIMDSFPQWVKFIKALNKEAFWRYEASKACNDKTWRSKYIELRVCTCEVASSDALKNKMTDTNLRYKKLALIKMTFKELGIQQKPPRIFSPIISFSTWKGIWV